MGKGYEFSVKNLTTRSSLLKAHTLGMADAKEILAAAKEAAQAVAAWGEATAAVVAATEVHIHALAEAAAQEDTRSFYMAARNMEDDDEGRGLGRSSINVGWSSMLAARREAATALQAKRVAEAVATQAKATAEAAIQNAKALAAETP